MRTRVCCAALLLAASSALMTGSVARADDKDAVTEMARRRFQEGEKFFDQKTGKLKEGLGTRDGPEMFAVR